MPFETSGFVQQVVAGNQSRSRCGGKQLGKRDRLVGAVGQSEVRYALAYLRSAGGARHVPDVNEEP